MLGGYDICEEGAKALADALKQNTALTKNSTLKVLVLPVGGSLSGNRVVKKMGLLNFSFAWTKEGGTLSILECPFHLPSGKSLLMIHKIFCIIYSGRERVYLQKTAISVLSVQMVLQLSISGGIRWNEQPDRMEEKYRSCLTDSESSAKNSMGYIEATSESSRMVGSARIEEKKKGGKRNQ